MFKEMWMRTRILSALIVMAVVMLPLTGCAKRENQAPVKGKTTTSTNAKTTKAPAKAPAPVSPPAAKSEPAAPATAGKSEPNASAPTVAEAPAKPVFLGQVLVAWNMGKRGEAINDFLQLNWQDPAVLQGIPVLSMTEQQFAALSQAQRDQMNQQVQQLSQTFRDIGKAVVASADSFIASKNRAGARARLEAAQQFGQALAAPERLAIIQLVGKAIMSLAQEKLSNIQ
jgi:hypothetical protein